MSNQDQSQPIQQPELVNEPTKEKKPVNILKRDLLTILIICIIIFAGLGILYYFEVKQDFITNLSENVFNAII
ncbi:MAG: hypothetical protein PHH01_00550 [Patescibacteria group bacterium]|nr:hypothetical protein [Patescibacteria group bacterium]MDD5566667.1 hypothetical protein [Patescibacteria group bacterium]